MVPSGRKAILPSGHAILLATGSGNVVICVGLITLKSKHASKWLATVPSVA